MASKEDPAPNFTAGETKLLVSIMKHMTGNPNTDWGAVAITQGYKDASIAKTRYNQIKKKKLDGGSASDAPSGGIDKASPGNLKAAGKPKKVAEDGAEGSPGKAKRVRKAKKVVEEVKEDMEGHMEEDGDKVKVEIEME